MSPLLSLSNNNQKSQIQSFLLKKVLLLCIFFSVAQKSQHIRSVHVTKYQGIVCVFTHHTPHHTHTCTHTHTHTHTLLGRTHIFTLQQRCFNWTMHGVHAPVWQVPSNQPPVLSHARGNQCSVHPKEACTLRCNGCHREKYKRNIPVTRS